MTIHAHRVIVAPVNVYDLIVHYPADLGGSRACPVPAPGGIGVTGAAYYPSMRKNKIEIEDNAQSP